MSNRIIFVALLTLTMISQTRADCDAILTSGLRNITVSYSAEAATARKYYNNYKKDVHSMSDDQLIQLEAEIFGSGKGNAGYSRQQRENDLSTWFETNKSVAEEAKSQYAASDTVYQGAVSAWSSCNALHANNVDIQPQISTDNRTVVMTIRYTGFTGTGPRFFGISAQNFSCNIDIPDDQLKSGIEITNQSISVTCNRKDPSKITINGEEFSKLERGTISVRTAANPFLLTFNEELTPALPKSEADKLNSSMRDIERRVRAIESINIENRMQKIEKDIPSLTAQISAIPTAYKLDWVNDGNLRLRDKPPGAGSNGGYSCLPGEVALGIANEAPYPVPRPLCKAPSIVPAR